MVILSVVVFRHVVNGFIAVERIWCSIALVYKQEN